MASTFIQFRIDEKTKLQASIICEQIGIDLQTYLRMSLKRLIANKDLPFLPINYVSNTPLMKAVKECQDISKENGNSEMTLDEINEEIRKAREENK